jgi:hypothetical protein
LKETVLLLAHDALTLPLVEVRPLDPTAVPKPHSRDSAVPQKSSQVISGKRRKLTLKPLTDNDALRMIGRPL